uniref:Methyltransferase like 3 n=1 Tax=Pipistrellus kuhlii TaxID=59472 RepID=A0A7J8B3E0_PIPKU|nr:methyltransferase like 3 [Pipistrellus kuhlii]
MSDTWSSIQAHKKQLDSLRERLQRRRKQDSGHLDLRNPEAALSPTFRSDSPVPTVPTSGGSKSSTASVPELATDPELEKKLLHHLSDLSLTLPTDAVSICLAISTPDAPATQEGVESLLQKFAAQELIEVKRGLLQDDAHPTLVTYADHSKLSAMMVAVAEKGSGEVTGTITGQKRRAEQDSTTAAAFSSSLASGLASSASETVKEPTKKSRKHAASDVDLEIESLLNQQSTKEQQSKKVGPKCKSSVTMEPRKSA